MFLSPQSNDAVWPRNVNISVGSDSPFRNLVFSDSAFHRESNKLKALDFKHLSSCPFSSLCFSPSPHLFQLFLVTVIFLMLGSGSGIIIAYARSELPFFCSLVVSL